MFTIQIPIVITNLPFLLTGEKPLISKWCLSGEVPSTTPRTSSTTTPPKPKYEPPSTPKPTPSYLPPVGEEGGVISSKSGDQRKGKKLADFVKEFNSKTSKKEGNKTSNEKLSGEEDTETSNEKQSEDDGYGEVEIGEDFVDDLAENYYYDYENQEIKVKNTSRRIDNGDTDREVEQTTVDEEKEGRSSREDKQKKKQVADKRSDDEVVEKIEENSSQNSLVFETTIPKNVKKVIESSVRPERQGNIKVAKAQGEEAKR